MVTCTLQSEAIQGRVAFGPWDHFCLSVQWGLLLSFLSVVGEKEKTSGTVNIRTRDNKVHGERTVSETIARLQQLQQSRSKQAEEEF